MFEGGPLVVGVDTCDELSKLRAFEGKKCLGSSSIQDGVEVWHLD